MRFMFSVRRLSAFRANLPLNVVGLNRLRIEEGMRVGEVYVST